MYVAKSEAKAMAEAGYRLALPKPICVAGRTGVATLSALLVNLREGDMVSEHDYTVTCKLAEVLCGGNIEAGTEVDEQWLLRALTEEGHWREARSNYPVRVTRLVPILCRVK